MTECDVVIVGGGIGGAALATALAADGLGVVVLEASDEYTDRVRGESMSPWGVKEARELGVEDLLLEAGAHVAAEWVHYDADVPTEMSESNPIPAGMIVPGVSGSMNLRHPDACAALIDGAAKAGARVIRGVQDLGVTAGDAPRVRFATAPDGLTELAPRLVVGADGRNSTVRRQMGIVLSRQEETHMVAGLLVEGLEGVSDERDFLGTEGDLFMASFHQGSGRVRVYLCPAVSQRHRFTGTNGLQEFLSAMAFDCLPFGEQLGACQPAGPLASYPGDESWCAEPFVKGVVLIGDAAGYNNPIIGQGLSIALRDARIVRDVIRAGDISPAAFAPYGEERLERMRRLRHAATFMAAALIDDGDDLRERRARFFQLQQTEPLMMGLLGAIFGGPEAGPPEAFDGRLLAAVRGN
jgi:2-polyprenyl-6-methoxyphenol hydroxylase-like FAD-dependent oxidoreductase